MKLVYEFERREVLLVLLRAMRDVALAILALEAMVAVLAVGGVLLLVTRGLGRGGKGLRGLLRRAAKGASTVEQRTRAFAQNPLSLALPLAGLLFGLGRRAWPWLRRFRGGR